MRYFFKIAPSRDSVNIKLVDGCRVRYVTDELLTRLSFEWCCDTTTLYDMILLYVHRKFSLPLSFLHDHLESVSNTDGCFKAVFS